MEEKLLSVYKPRKPQAHAVIFVFYMGLKVQSYMNKVNWLSV